MERAIFFCLYDKLVYFIIYFLFQNGGLFSFLSFIIIIYIYILYIWGGDNVSTSAFFLPGTVRVILVGMSRRIV